MAYYGKRPYKVECNIPTCTKKATFTVYGDYGGGINERPLGKYCGRHANQFLKALKGNEATIEQNTKRNLLIHDPLTV